MTDRCCHRRAIIVDKYCVHKSLHDIRTSISFLDVDVRVPCERVRVFFWCLRLACSVRTTARGVEWCRVADVV